MCHKKFINHQKSIASKEENFSGKYAKKEVAFQYVSYMHVSREREREYHYSSKERNCIE